MIAGGIYDTAGVFLQKGDFYFIPFTISFKSE